MADAKPASDRQVAATLVAELAAKLPPPAPAADAEHVTRRQDGDTLEARSTSRTIRTVDDLLRHIEADLSKYEVAASEATKWETATGDGDGGAHVTELFRVFVRLKPKAGPNVRECVEAMIRGAGLRRPAVKRARPAGRAPVLQLLVVADTHFGGYAWGRTAGGDYDLAIAEALVHDAGTRLLEIGDGYRPERRIVVTLGDVFHYDTPGGTTTGLTPLERDGRLQKMLEVGCQTLLGLVERSAATAPTDLLVVNGNHDEALTWAWQRIALERFRGDKRVRVSTSYRARQYATYGANLLGFAHGHKGKKRLPELMALEASADWAACPYREYHTGHLHHAAAERSQILQTVNSVIVRTAPTLAPPDDWHAQAGFLGSRQCMETYIYAKAGGLAAMHVAGPALERRPPCTN